MSKKKEDLEAVVGMTVEETADAAVSEVAETDDLIVSKSTALLNVISATL